MAIPSVSLAAPPVRARLLLRAAGLAGGVLAIGVGVTLALRSGLGAGPWDVLHEGLARASGLDIGLVAILVGLGAFALWFPLRLRPGVGTVVAVVMVGVVVQCTFPFIPDARGLGAQLTMTLVGVVVTGVGVACCIRSRLGTSPRDGIAIGIAQLGFPLWSIRIAIDVTLVGIGAVLGGRVGVGTVLGALFVGPVIAATLTLFNRVMPERAR